MRYIKYFVFVFVSLSLQATELKISTLSYTVDASWESVVVLPDSSVLLRQKNIDTILKTWKSADLFQDNSEYIESLQREEEIYSPKNFIDCITKVNCKSKQLKKYVELLPAYNVLPSKSQSICNNKRLTCIIFPSVIPNYQYEAFIYNKNLKWEFVRVTTTNSNKESFIKFINGFTIKGI
jgi:hypothetical protein